MKRGIQCNDTLKAEGKQREYIRYEYACKVDEIGETVIVSLGDTDPVTGKVLDNPEFFEKYHRLRDFEIKKNLEAIGRALPNGEEKERKALGEELAARFKEQHGYPPDRKTKKEMLDAAWPKPVVLHLGSDDYEENEKAERSLDCADPAAEAAFPGNESDDTIGMRNIFERLNDRQKAVYEAMLANVDSKSKQVKWSDLAKHWDVSCSQILRDKYKIIEKIRKYSEKEFRFSYDRRK